MSVMQTAVQQFVQERIAGQEKEGRAVPLSTRVSPAAMKRLKQYASVLSVTPSTLARALIEAGLEETEAEIKRLTTRRGKG